jgi:PBP1b-binding outer membrane lipoprotein LpoB
MGAVVARLILVTVLLSGCVKRSKTSDSYRSVSPVPPREGAPIDQKTVLPQREKIIMKKPPSP